MNQNFRNFALWAVILLLLVMLFNLFQNPTGHLMPEALRESLVATAHAVGTELVVDESFVDLPLDGTPMPPPVAVHDRHSRVV